MVGLPLAAQITGNDEWLTAAAARAQNNLLSPAGLFSATMARVGLAMVAVQRGDVASAEEQYSALAPVPGIMVFYIGTDQVLGQLSVTLGRLDQAIIHFEDSRAFCRNAGYRPNLAWTCYDYAGALLQRNNSADWENAVALLDESMDISTELGMRPLVERITLLQAIAASPPVRQPNLPDGLTQREVEVLRLVAAGRTDREIADELMIAPRTATTHVGHILTKTNSANRAEAAVYAARQGLVS